MSTTSDPRPGRSGARWWLSAAVMSATALLAGYFLDPVRGRERRNQLAERAGGFVRRNPLKFSGAAVTEGGWPQEPPPDVDSDG